MLCTFCGAPAILLQTGSFCCSDGTVWGEVMLLGITRASFRTPLSQCKSDFKWTLDTTGIKKESDA